MQIGLIHREAPLFSPDFMEKLHRKDPAVFAEVYDGLKDMVYRNIYYKVGIIDVAEDLTEEVFCKAWERVDRFQYRNIPIQHWLLRISRNVVIDHWRARWKNQTGHLEDNDEFLTINDGFSVEERVEKDLETETLGKAMARLPDMQRDVLVLRFIEELPHKDVAVAVGKSVEAVRQIQSRALRALNKLMVKGEEMDNLGRFVG